MESSLFSVALLHYNENSINNSFQIELIFAFKKKKKPLISIFKDTVSCLTCPKTLTLYLFPVPLIFFGIAK